MKRVNKQHSFACRTMSGGLEASISIGTRSCCCHGCYCCRSRRSVVGHRVVDWGIRIICGTEYAYMMTVRPHALPRCFPRLWWCGSGLGLLVPPSPPVTWRGFGFAGGRTDTPACLGLLGVFGKKSSWHFSVLEPPYGTSAQSQGFGLCGGGSSMGGGVGGFRRTENRDHKNRNSDCRQPWKPSRSNCHFVAAGTFR